MGTWSRRKAAFKGTDAAVVDPYEDWEYVTRPDPQAHSGGAWQPVHIRLTRAACGCAASPCPHPGGRSYAPHAQALLAALAASPGAIAMGSDSQRTLHRLIAREAAGQDPEPLHYLFIYRPEMQSYAPLTSDTGADLYTVRHVGVAVPGSSVVANPAVPPAAHTDHPKRPDIVLTAVIDDSIGIANERFRAADGTTRIAKFWMQAVEAFAPRPGGATVSIGQEFDAARIDALLGASAGEDSFYRALRRDTAANARPASPGPRPESFGFQRPIGLLDSHGTHVMDIAGGRPPQTAETGDRPLVAVEIPAMATRDTSGGRLAAFALQAVQRILHWADTWRDGDLTVRVSVVINFSYGISAGPKNGTGFLEREIARLIDARSAEGLPTKLVMPAGNNYRDRLSAAFQVPFKGSRAFDWCVIPCDHSVSYLELRCSAGSPFTLSLQAPNGDRTRVPVTPGADASVHEWRLDGSDPVGAIYVQPSPSEAGDLRITLALAPTASFGARRAPAGTYEIALINDASGEEIALDVWADVQRDDTPSGYPIFGRQSYLDDAGAAAVDPVLKSYDAPGPGSVVARNGTMSAFATSRSANVFAIAGSYPDDNSWANRDPARKAPTWYTASGPTRGADGRDPALAAVSEEGRALFGVMAAGTYSGSVSQVSGTSAAAPQAARRIVDILMADPKASRAQIIAGLLGAGQLPASDRRLGSGVLPAPFRAEGRARRRPYP